MKIENVQAVKKALLERIEKTPDKVSVYVGYTMDYAVYVHEVDAKHEPGKQWKYLSDPMRLFANVLADIIAKGFKKTKDMRKALILAGLRLQRESQKVVPIDTGALRASAWTAPEEDVGTESMAAYARGQDKRSETNKKRIDKENKMKRKK